MSLLSGRPFQLHCPKERKKHKLVADAVKDSTMSSQASSGPIRDKRRVKTIRLFPFVLRYLLRRLLLPLRIGVWPNSCPKLKYTKTVSRLPDLSNDRYRGHTSPQHQKKSRHSQGPTLFSIDVISFWIDFDEKAKHWCIYISEYQLTSLLSKVCVDHEIYVETVLTGRWGVPNRNSRGWFKQELAVIYGPSQKSGSFKVHCLDR